MNSIWGWKFLILLKYLFENELDIWILFYNLLNYEFDVTLLDDSQMHNIFHPIEIQLNFGILTMNVGFNKR
jgi:hypothetical protein